MRVISLWQPYASLLVHGFKLNETRPFPAPSTVLRQRIGIAATKSISPQQRFLVTDPDFADYYAATGLPPLDQLPLGALVGSVYVHSSDLITEDDIYDTTQEELLFGDWRVGRYVWRCRDHQALENPIPCQGQQGIWIWPDETKVLNFNRAK